MTLPPIVGFIRRFGFARGFEFYRVARKCDRDTHLLRSWEIHYRAVASRELRHDNESEAKVYLAFAEMLQTTHDKIVLNRKPRRPILTNRQLRIERHIKRRMKQRRW